MLKPTKPFKDTVTNYPKEPCLRIGKQVPKNAVNLAYYYNPTATDAEKVLTAEAPRNTIDHRVEDAYRYLFNQAKDDDSLFPSSVPFEDENGYRGQLGRMYTQWYAEAHIETKNVQETQDVIVINKSEVPKMYEYSDDAGYEGSLYLDAVEYEVTKTKDVSTTTHLDREVFTHELNYREIFGSYIEPKAIDAWLIPPTESKSLWPQTIAIDEIKCTTTSGITAIIDFVNNTPNPYDEACGVLSFDSIEYEQVYKSSATNGSIESININSVFKSDEYEISYDVATAETEARALMQSKYEATYDPTTDKYNYEEIQEWLDMARERCVNQESVFFGKIEQAINNNKDIVIFINSFNMVVDDESSGESNYRFEATYGYKIASRGADASYQYNIVVNYKGKLVKTIAQKKEIPAEYRATCNYTGLVRKVWNDYDGVAYYRGSVTKGNSIGNVNPNDDNEILMFSDDEGYLRRPVRFTDENGETAIKNFYDVEADYIYLTNVFKNGKACFYKYPLKKDIYDYRGPDDNGFYNGNAVKVCTANSKKVPNEYAYNIKLRVAETEIVDSITNDFQIVSKEIPKRYSAELYTSFVSSSTDTFNVTYNAFNDSNEDNIAIDNGVTEDIYNYPFMYRGVDFFIEKQENLTRINKVRLLTPKVIEDTRRYVTFRYTITAERKEDGKKFTTSERTVSILNRDFAVPAEYKKFDGRGMIISPESNDTLLSPFDLVLYDQASLRIEPVIKPKDTGFIFYATITKINDIYRGAVNIKCNADGSGYITAETTIDTGFFDEKSNSFTKKLCIDNPYWMENGKIYPGFKVKCIDSRHIKVNAPRNDGLLESWYPMIQFGHYSQVMDQYGAHTKVFYSMPEYDTQHYSSVYGMPYVDIEKEKVTVLNSHMVKTSCSPLFVKNVSNSIDGDMYFYKDKMYKVFKQSITWKDAQAFCKSLGGNLAMPKTQELGDFIINIATQYNLNGLWLGATDEETEGVWKWVDGTTMTYNNWNNGEPNNSGGNEHYLKTYTKNNSGKWNDLANNNTVNISGFICEFDLINTVKLYKEIDGELFNIKIKDISFSDGIIITEDTISENDNIICDYTYVEENYVYRGFWRNTNDFARIDLNPNMYHTYSDMNYIPSVTKPSKNLFNKVIYFFMRPSLIVEGIDVVYPDNNNATHTEFQFSNPIVKNEDTLYHQIDNPHPENDHDIYIGSVYIRQNTSLHSTVIVDSRTRGGGVIKEMSDSLRRELEPDSDFYLDIGFFDGEPYQENGVIIVRLDNSLLKEFGGIFTHEEIDAKVRRWLGLGVYPIIEYVDTYSKQDMPQHNLVVEDSYTNVINETPQIYLECVDV